MAEKTQYIATGRRKNSVARVRLIAGDGKMMVNGRPLKEYFPRGNDQLIIMQPVELVKLEGKFDLFALASGGGLSGQAGAIKQGIARALVKYDTANKAAVKKAGFLTRDSRMRERKKYGRKRARRRFQYTKR